VISAGGKAELESSCKGGGETTPVQSSYRAGFVRLRVFVENRF
jgi:hypothetical protein